MLPKSPIGQALQYVLPCWDGLVCYCENRALSIDNNLNERSIRPVAIGRKNYLFMGSDNGGKTAAILYSIMASAKANRVEPFAYVRDLLSQLSGCSPPAVSTLLPDCGGSRVPGRDGCHPDVVGVRAVCFQHAA